MKRLLTLICVLPLLSSAQDSETGNWFQYFGNQKISKRWNWHNEVQYRNYNFAGDLEQLLLRTGFGYNLSENNNNLLAGYGYIISENYVPGTDTKVRTTEHRFFEQFITRQRFGRVYLQHRYRIEQRLIGDQDLRWRFRYFLSANVALNKKELAKGALYLSAYNEIFVNGQRPAFDRNRVYGALGYCFTPELRLELGYMSQIQETRQRPQFQVAFFNNLPLTRRDPS
ncbi:DUF2490 domain-containing protein [Flaviaesturariibacter amylovorans]|uniref:DUF2490 domain-containing protein n=1 Tax=Flaviaesturariibacter amylovorans TaxID=1084520 RepID=A0ABP8GME6_9BACT